MSQVSSSRWISHPMAVGDDKCLVYKTRGTGVAGSGYFSSLRSSSHVTLHLCSEGEKEVGDVEAQILSRQLYTWTVLLGLSVFTSFHLAPSKAEEVTEDATSEQARKTPEEHGVNPDTCDFSFHIPWSGSACPPTVPASPPASQEDLDHLKTLLQDCGSILTNLQAAAASEASQSRYQDIVSELLPGIRDTNSELHEILQKFLRELEDHIQEDDHPHVADEKKK
uniref:Uncharacterized protein n=1 Tax=Sphaerodactylus townsendi TaxID=933632 RepID=A0ACB8G8X8_9SAUR